MLYHSDYRWRNILLLHLNHYFLLLLLILLLLLSKERSLKAIFSQSDKLALSSFCAIEDGLGMSDGIALLLHQRVQFFVFELVQEKVVGLEVPVTDHL